MRVFREKPELSLIKLWLFLLMYVRGKDRYSKTYQVLNI